MISKQKMQQYADELTDDMAKAILSKNPQCKEVLAGALAAAANIIVVTATRMTKDINESTELIALAISGAYRMVLDAEKELKEEKTNE